MKSTNIIIVFIVFLSFYPSLHCIARLVVQNLACELFTENGGVNMFPKLYVDLNNAAASHDLDKVQILRDKVMQISTSIYKVGRFG